ncbi:addiction module toxin RelE [Streptococcus cuniculi]|uniref:Addiction module toxin RelE n=1 Tax=Streptococcus cuniculi TaxID=1432788 RepID=A0A1Q8E9U5_9STRE|nr:type II toxin-antitoxin system RelE/ParE family toxin [Streptococcus cuniculi]OLF48565.1 addiction module toxin RelE [Streptococcus cuniculi]
MTNFKCYKVSLADRAKQDLREIHDYILVNFYSRQSADAKLELILTALEILETFPEACPLVSSRGYGQLTDDGKVYRYMPIENYLAFYYIENYDVYVARILNSRQDWAKLFNK